MHLLMKKSTIKYANNITDLNILGKDIHKLSSVIHDTWFHGTRCATPRAGAPVRAAPQCSAALLSFSFFLNILNAFLINNNHGNYTSCI